jgi:hypothetical protein
MRLRSVLSAILLLTLAANPCVAKDSHTQHGVRASAAGNAASGNGGSGAKPPPSKANVPSDAEAIVAPPVLPPHGVTHQQFRISPSAKPIALGNPPRNSSAIVPASIARNAIGQPVAAAKTFAGAQPAVLASQRPVASPPLIPARPAALSVSPAAAHVNLANATNRGSINGAAVVRPAAGPSLIGGPAQLRYGINGTTVQNKH